ncbi:anthrone oxygenase family protein [Arthrobacter psychrolactophilus]
MRQLILQIARTTSVFIVGLYAGGVFLFSLAPSVGRLPATSYLPYWQALNADYASTMPPLLLLGLVLLIVTCVSQFRHSRLTFGLTAAAVVLLAATIVLTVTQLEPLNQLANGWSLDQLPADWEGIRKHWWSLHTGRTVLALLAFAALLVADASERISQQQGAARSQHQRVS